MTYTAQSTVNTPLGDMLLARSMRGLAGAWFVEGQKDTPDALAEVPYQPKDALLNEAAEQLRRYWTQAGHSFNLPLDLLGTPFQCSVWQLLLKIGPGEQRSYGDIARSLGKPQAFRAVGMAVGRNPLSIIVPCHRVMGQQGHITGYSGGVQRKVSLLQHEGFRIEGMQVLSP
jgi:methylated-DNA-[protein]-cysteine S-methyltransferase